IEASYYDIDGALCEASQPALSAMVAALTEGTDTRPSVLAPVTVFWEGLGVLLVTPRAGDLGRTLTLRVTLEHGEPFQEQRSVSSLPLAVPPEDAVTRRWLLPHTLPWGYHELSLQDGEQVHRGTIFSAPREVWQGRVSRAWGVFAPTYALHSERS